MIAAGVNPKALQEFMGHSSITITLDRYGHLFPGARQEAAGMMDRYLDAGRGADLGGSLEGSKEGPRAANAGPMATRELRSRDA
jgi:hypothetical protein